jgi:hypothetical protein
MQISTACLDLFVCCVICQMIYDTNITSLVARGGNLRELHDTVSMSSSENSEINISITTTLESDADEKEARFLRQMDDATHRNSFLMQGISYYECVKATSLWLDEMPLEFQNEEESCDEVFINQQDLRATEPSEF